MTVTVFGYLILISIDFYDFFDWEMWSNTFFRAWYITSVELRMNESMKDLVLPITDTKS